MQYSLRSQNEIVYQIMRRVFRALFSVLSRVSVEGIAHIPASGPVILACNHLTYIDGPLVLSVTPRRLRGVVAREFRAHPFAIALSAVGSIYVRRGALDRAAMRQCLVALQNGEALAIAIEGALSKTGGLRRGMTGVAWLASRTRAPIVPIAISGVEHTVRQFARLRKPVLKLIVGRPLFVTAGCLTARELAENTERVMLSLAELLPAENRGYYG